MFELLKEFAKAISEEIIKLGYKARWSHEAVGFIGGHITSITINRKIRYDIYFTFDTFQIVSECDIVFWTTELEDPSFTPYKIARAILNDAVFRDETYSQEGIKL